MARGTSRDEGVNADPGGQNVSTTPALGSMQQSNNAWLGIDSRIEAGTPGSRPNTSHAAYGGDREQGTLYKGSSAGMDSAALKQTNSAFGQEKMSWNAMGQYGPGSPNYIDGGFGAREQMTIGGDKNRGQYVGDGVGSTPDANMTEYFISGKTPIQMPKNQFLAGTDEARDGNMARAKRGLGKGYPRSDSRNQSM